MEKGFILILVVGSLFAFCCMVANVGKEVVGWFKKTKKAQTIKPMFSNPVVNKPVIKWVYRSIQRHVGGEWVILELVTGGLPLSLSAMQAEAIREAVRWGANPMGWDAEIVGYSISQFESTYQVKLKRTYPMYDPYCCTPWGSVGRTGDKIKELYRLELARKDAEARERLYSGVWCTESLTDKILMEIRQIEIDKFMKKVAESPEFKKMAEDAMNASGISVEIDFNNMNPVIRDRMKAAIAEAEKPKCMFGQTRVVSGRKGNTEKP